ncbi:MAG: hypothetical protein II194_09240, partial [Bacteroidales bacterium]|nr:hypothetical protein [Bacteroidales bacterium]
PIATVTGQANDNTYKLVADGIEAIVKMNRTDVTTSYAEIHINNEALTQHTYKDVNGNGAKYTLTITIKSDHNSSWANYVENKGDIVITQDFYVKHECPAYEPNPLYYDAERDAIVIKGQLNSSDKWEMSSVIREHFLKIGGKDVYAYFNDKTVNGGHPNLVANSLDFFLAATETNVSLTGTAPVETLKLTKAMATPELKTTVYYTVDLVNGETCDDQSYDVIFVNPFLDGSDEVLKIWGNEVGTVTGESMPLVKVVDYSAGDVIYSYDATAAKLVLSKKATDIYKVAEPTVTYAFATKAEVPSTEIDDVKSQISNASNLAVDANGVITWNNEGSTLVKDHYIPVIATVTFADLSVVKCVIDVYLTKDKPVQK